MTKQQWLIAGIGLAAVAALGWLWRAGTKDPAPEPLAPLASPLLAATSAPATKAAPREMRPLGAAFTIDPADVIASWEFKGAYAGNTELSAKAHAEITRLTGLLGRGEYTDYSLYVSIANQYDLLGDGANEFAYLKKALALDSTGTGLAWHNAGQLLARLGAPASARTALERAVAAQSTLQYHQALLDFLKAHYPEDVSAITKEEQAISGAPSEAFAQ